MSTPRLLEGLLGKTEPLALSRFEVLIGHMLRPQSEILPEAIGA
jgi:hypothetical protein